MPTYVVPEQRVVTTDGDRYPELFAEALPKLPISAFRLQTAKLAPVQEAPDTRERTFKGNYPYVPLVTTMGMRAPSGMIVAIEMLTGPSGELLGRPRILLGLGEAGVIDINVGAEDLQRIGVSVDDAAFAHYVIQEVIKHAKAIWPAFAQLEHEDVSPTDLPVWRAMTRQHPGG